MRVTLLYTPDCPNWRTVDALLGELRSELGLHVDHREIDGLEAATRHGFVGSPTVLIDGVDPFPSAAGPSLACRLYPTATGLAGVPPAEELRTALRTAASDA